MKSLLRDKLYRDTVFKVLLPAEQISDGAIVTKKTGDTSYTLRNILKVYTSNMKNDEEKKEIEIEGYFLFGERGQINQIDHDTILGWQLTFEELGEIWEQFTYEEENK